MPPLPLIDPHTMITGDVADTLDLSVARVHQLDEELRPVRNRNGHRRYNPRVVAEYLASRGAK